MSGVALGFGNSSESLESQVSRAPALPLRPCAGEMPGLSKGHKQFGTDRMTFVSLSQVINYV